LSADAWEAFSRRLFDQNRFAIKLGLDNIRRALHAEGHPERRAPAIIVGGTNGKGSTASSMAGILQAHGLRVGLYTSPHLIEVRERFRIDGQPVSRETVLDVGRRVLDRYGQPGSDPVLTFFELTTLMASLIFADAHVDVAIYEVGLGGRLDAVNAIEPALTVITNIDLDHQKYLGDTLAEVAAQKAGLHRSGVPLVLGVQTHSEVESVFDFPETLRVTTRQPPPAPLIDWDQGFVRCASAHENRRTARVAARTFLERVDAPRHEWTAGRAEEGLAQTRWPGRMDPRIVEVQGRARRFLLDAAHNPAGTRRLYDVFAVSPPGAVVVGAMRDKEHAAMFAPLADLEVPVFIAPPDSERSASADALRASMPRARICGVGASHEMFVAAAEYEPYVAVFGSIYLLGEWFAWAGIEAGELTTWAPS
jgi:dihydrofolate synthase/folylpolyglutamate synthase